MRVDLRRGPFLSNDEIPALDERWHLVRIDEDGYAFLVLRLDYSDAIYEAYQMPDQFYKKSGRKPAPLVGADESRVPFPKGTCGQSPIVRLP